MKSRPFPAIVCGLIFLALLMASVHVGAGEKKTKKTFCSNPYPEQLCSAKNTCGSAGSPCVLEVKRTGGGSDASVSPNIPDFAKDVRLNLTSMASDETLDAQTKYGLFLASAIATRNPAVISAMENCSPAMNL